jgi:AcrR family transcriptional regulator
MTEPAHRPYSSPLRDWQAQQTRDHILDSLTELLGELPATEITTREIAERAGVSQPTIYRHFPDRQALLEGLTARIESFVAEAGEIDSVQTIDELVARAVRGIALTETRVVEATAEALLNADPRRLSSGSRARSAELRRVVENSFPDYDEHDHNAITALLRNLYSVQTWLRMREEFGILGEESGPIVAWAMEVLVKEIRAGNFPRR